MSNAALPRRILCLLPFPPRSDAAHGGGRVTAQLIRRLADHNQLGLLYLRAPGEPPPSPDLTTRCAFVDEVARPTIRGDGRHAVPARLRQAGYVLSGTPLWAAKYRVPEFTARVRARAAAWRPDLVQADYHVMGQFLRDLPCRDAARVLVCHEPGAANSRAAAANARGMERIARLVEARSWARFERRLMENADAVVAFTPRDRKELERHGTATPVVEIPLGAELPAEPANPVGIEPPRLLFVGNFMHPPNVDAALWLGREIFPRVKRVVPHVELDIVGDHAPAEVRRLAEVPGLRVTGRVPEVAPYLDRAAVVVVPLRLGGGMRVKLVEALAAGKAVVATPLATDGLDTGEALPLLVAELAGDLAAAICTLLQDATRRAALAHHAAEWARRHLGWERSVQQYVALYDRLCGTRSDCVRPTAEPV